MSATGPDLAGAWLARSLASLGPVLRSLAAKAERKGPTARPSAAEINAAAATVETIAAGLDPDAPPAGR